MRKFKSIVSSITAIIMVTALLVACKSDITPSESQQTENMGDDTIELNLYLMGDPAKDHDAILEELNKLTLRDFNATVKITYSTWIDFDTKYNLMLSAGDKMDLVYAANWLNYFTYAKKGAFRDLTDLIHQYAPKLYEQITADRWEGVKVDNKIYAVPNQNPEFVQGAFLYREDLRKKHNLPEIDSVDTIEAYLDGIKKYEPTIMPTNDPGSKAYDNLFIFTTPYEIVDAGDTGTSNLLIDPKDPIRVLETIETPEYRAFMEKMKAWADKGFWSRSSLSSNEDGTQSVESGKAAATFDSTLPKAKGVVERLQKEKPEWEIGVFEYNRISNKVHSASPTQNLTAIPNVSKYPELALALLEKLMTDKEYYYLIQYGIKDLSYNLTEDGQLDYTNIDRNEHGAPAAWAWINTNLELPQVGRWAEWEPRVEENLKLATPNILEGFVINTDAIQNEIAAVNQIKNQYGKPLQAGLVKDVEESYMTLLSKSKAAGLDKYRDEVQKQLRDYFNIKK
ncbi:ABC transporter substrate-binding protein [Clostridium thermarum]|uniref:ABC transporter substrate-binding protein n=1 Tax=Clostridium thermarum TaxID=1716543 RepID=UPI00111E12B6|nr:extracellular solute-binding protein [Clostridium thermarum]